MMRGFGGPLAAVQGQRDTADKFDLFIADALGQRIRKADRSGIVTKVASKRPPRLER